jgi:hypothetical protein
LKSFKYYLYIELVYPMISVGGGGGGGGGDGERLGYGPLSKSCVTDATHKSGIFYISPLFHKDCLAN